MPRVEISAAQGLVQRAGQGFVDAGVKIHASGGRDLRSSPTAAELGAIVHIVGGSANVSFVLPNVADSFLGQIKIVINGTAGNTVTLDSNNSSLGDKAMTSPGDMAVCVFNGTEWVPGLSIA